MKLLRRKEKLDEPDIYETTQEADHITQQLIALGQDIQDQHEGESKDSSADDDLSDTLIRAARSVA